MMRCPQIPSELFLEILVWLPVNTLLRFKSVSKEWCTLISSPLFIQLQLQKSLESNSQRNRGLLVTLGVALELVADVYHPSKITTLEWPEGTLSYNETAYSVGVCNGLACFRVRTYSRKMHSDYGWANFFIICNPSMCTFKITPPPIEKEWTGIFLSCFGYDSEHDDYKIVATPEMVEDGSVREMLIYSLKADLWKCVTPTPSPSLLVSSGDLGNPVFVNNMIHYRIYDVGSGRRARFDLSSEKWMDDFLLLVADDSSEFGVLDGYIYQSASINDDSTSNNYGSTDVWIMDKYGGKESESSWSKMFHLPGQYFQYTLIARSKEGSSLFILLQSNGVYCLRDGLNWYDQQENTSVQFLPEIKIRRLEESVELYIKSLVPIPGCSLIKMQQFTE